MLIIVNTMFPVANVIIKMIVIIVISYVRSLVNITLVNYLLVVIIVITAGLIIITILPKIIIILPKIIIIFCVIIVAISHLVSLSFVVGAPLCGSIDLVMVFVTPV